MNKPHINDANKQIIGWTRAVARWTAVLALCTIASVLVSLLQWRTLVQTDETAKNAERPLVVVKNLDMGLLTDDDNPVQIHASIPNTGRTPAFVTKMDFETYIGETLPAEPSFPHAFEEGFVVSSDGVATTPNFFLKIGKDEKNKILQGKDTLYLYGFVEYTDIFGRYHHSGFAYRYMNAIKDSNIPALFTPASPKSYWEQE